MEDLGQLRIYVSERYFPLLHELSGNNYFTQNSEFFLYCACVGEKYGRKEKLVKRHELCRAVTLTEYDKTIIKTIFYKQNDCLSNAKEMISLAEEFAEGGLSYLIEHVLNEYVEIYDDGTYHVKVQQGIELQYALSKFVLKELQEVPF